MNSSLFNTLPEAQLNQQRNRTSQGLQGRMNEIANNSVIPHIALDENNNVEG